MSTDNIQPILGFDQAQRNPLLIQVFSTAMRCGSILLSALLLLTLTLFTPVTYAAQDYKLSDTLVLDGEVTSHEVSPDGNWVVYRADQDMENVMELYSVPMTGGTPIKLNDALVANGDVDNSFLISPDSSRVVYLADQDTDGVVELYSVPLAGGTSVKLNGPLTAGGDVWDFGDVTISPDSSRVVYLADQDTDGVDELYSVPLAGGTSVKLNDPLAVGGDVYYRFKISPDSSRAVYFADQDTDGVDEIYSVPLTGGTAVKLNGPLTAGGEVVNTFGAIISPDSSRVVYRADQDTDTVSELYSVPVTGGIAVKLNGALGTNGDVSSGFLISPDSSQVVYRADQDTDDDYELYSVLLEGGTPVILNGALVSGGDVTSGFLISPDNSQVVYRADQDTDEVLELYSVPLTGGTSIKLNGTLVAGGDVSSYQISPDGSRVVYQADQDTDTVTELYSVPLAGGTSIKLNDPVNGRVANTQITPDSSRVVYIAAPQNSTSFDLYSVPLVGSASPVTLNSPLAGGSVSQLFTISPDSNRVVYESSQAPAFFIDELYGALLPIDSFPYSENFEGGFSGWTSDGSLWELGTPANTVIQGASNGANAWITGLNSNYSSSAFEAVVSPVFDFTGLMQDPIIEMDVWWQSQHSFDGAVLQSTIDGGTTWLDVGANGDPDNWFNDDTINGLASNSQSGNGWTGRDSQGNGSGAYVKASHTLTGLAGKYIQLRVLFGSNVLINDDGFAFDNIFIGLPIDSFPYTESFESGPAGWTYRGDLWELGTPSYDFIIGASDGDNAWITDLNANYPNNALGQIRSPTFDFTGFTEDPIIAMDVWWQSELSFDGAVLQSSINGGTTWVDVGVNGDPDNWFNDNTINGLTGQTGHGWTGRDVNGSGGYVRASHSLTGLAGESVILRVLFGSDSGTTDNGFAFDNVFIGLADFDGDGDPDSTDPDDDNDGLTDVYENVHGLDPFDASDAAHDPDMDGLTSLEEFTLNTNLDPNDPDTDGDGIDDGLDAEPLMTSNDCSGGTMSGALFVDATFMETVIADISCGATDSITVQPTIVQLGGSLVLIAPTVKFEPGFNAAGELRVNTENSCANCGP